MAENKRSELLLGTRCASGNLPGLSFLPAPGEAPARRTRLPGAARCVRPRLLPRPASPGPGHARTRASFRTRSRAARDTCGRSAALLLTKGGRRALAAAPPASVSAPARPARRVSPAPRGEQRQAAPDAAPRVRRRLRVAEVWAPTPHRQEPIPQLLPLSPQASQSCVGATFIPGGAQPPLVAQCLAGSGSESAKTRGDRGPVTHSRQEVGEGQPPARSQHCTCADASAAGRPRVL